MSNDIFNENMNDFFTTEESQSNNMGTFFEEPVSEPEQQPAISVYEEFSEDELIEMIVQKSCGKDENSIPKGAINLIYEKRNYETDNSQILREMSTNAPEVSIFRRLEFIQIDLTFGSALASDLKVFWNTFERFGRDLNNLTEETKNLPFLSLTIIPIEENGRYYITCTNPILWTLQPSTVGGKTNMLRILYKAEDMNFFASEGFSDADIEASALRMMQERERESATYYEKQRQEMEAQEKRNQEAERNRRNYN